jgi:hypothetical protein
MVAGFGTLFCGLLLTTSTMAQQRAGGDNGVSDRSDIAHAPGFVTATNHTPPAGDDGSIAGGEIWNNGTLIPAPCALPSGCPAGGTRSPLQDATQGLNVFGTGCSAAVINTFLADDFTLPSTTNLSTIELYLYQTGATAPSITNVILALHSGPAIPASPTSNVLQTLVGAPQSVTLEPIFRSTEATVGCTRQIQKVVLNVAAWPDLPAGSYWISWQAAGTVASGPWCPHVTVCGACGKPGANAQVASTNTAGAFAPATDTGGGVGCENAPEDLPFIIRGTPVGGNPCPANIVNTGTSVNKVDVDDLLAVISQWGPCPAPPAPCPANVVNTGTSANRVDVDDLLAVISGWGPCP